MSRHNSIWRLAISAFGILAAIAWSAQDARALNQYQYVTDTDNTGNWFDSASWDPNPTSTYPNASDAKALIVAPIRSGTSTANYSLAIAGTNITIAELKVDNSAFANNFNVNMTTSGGTLTFQSSLLDESNNPIPAKYIETAGTSMTGSTRYTYNPIINVLSDWSIFDDNVVNLNTGTTFSNIINGDSTKTITKDGHGAIQFSANLGLLSGEGFLGKYIINQGGIRLIGTSAIIKSTGITVNSGGQLQLADNGGTSIAEWKLATGAVLKLNGAGKAVVPNITTADGALRIGITGGRSTTFDNDVVLESDSVISVAATNTSGTLDGIVSGPGGLTKHGNGTLILTNSNDSYGGDTHVLSGPGTLMTDTPSILSVTNPIFPDGKDVYLASARAFLNLNFDGIDTIRSLYIDGALQSYGTWGATGSGADHESALITGLGKLLAAGLPGDYNGDGKVDGGDYAVWRKGGSLRNEVHDPDSPDGVTNQYDYDQWRLRYGNGTPAGGPSLSLVSVPEPATIVLLTFIAPLLAGRRLGRTRK